jgi:formamidase
VLRGLTGAKFDEMAKVAARTVPPREHGGNTDIKDLSAGTRIFFPVYVKGAGFSMGDLHFSQGDGEIGFCGAIEMDGVSHVGFDLIKGGMASTTSLAHLHAQHRQAALRAVADLRRHQRGKRREPLPRCHRGLSPGLPEGHRLPDPLRLHRQPGLHAAHRSPVEGRIGGIVDIPNCACTVALPTSIFDQDITPKGMLNDNRIGAARASDQRSDVCVPGRAQAWPGFSDTGLMKEAPCPCTTFVAAIAKASSSA